MIIPVVSVRNKENITKTRDRKDTPGKNSKSTEMNIKDGQKHTTDKVGISGIV